MKTLDSLSSPLRIDALQVADGQGWLGMTLCPGKKQPNSISCHWNRDLDIDLQAVRAWGASLVLTLMEEHEFERVEVADLPRRVHALGMDWLHLPIPDRCAPTESFETAWKEQGPLLHQRLTRGERILIHCLGGIGRTGTVAVRLLMERGWAHATALAEVRRVRLGAVETRVQEVYLEGLAVPPYS